MFDGRNYLHLAYNRYTRLERNSFLLLWKKSGLDINSVDDNGNTLLDNAVLNTDPEYVSFFLALGMNAPTMEKAMQKAVKGLAVYEQEYQKAANDYDMQKLQAFQEICRSLQERMKQGEN